MIYDKKEFEEKLQNVNIDISKNHTYRLSISYLARSFLLVLIFLVIIFNIGIKIPTNFNIREVFILILEFILMIFSIIYIYTIITYKIIVDTNTIYYQKLIISIKQIKNIEIRKMKILNKKLEPCLVLLTDDGREYVFRLNIMNYLKLIKQISLLSKQNIKVNI